MDSKLNMLTKYVNIKKIWLPLCILLATAVYSCKKGESTPMISPAPVYFEIVDKNGNTMVTSTKDSVAVTYTDNNVAKVIKLSVLRLSLHHTPDTVFSKSYGGLYLSDNALMSTPSYSKTSPVRNFSISLNGTNLGTIYLDYVSYLSAYPLATSAFTFNGTVVTPDNSVPIVAGSYYNLNILKVNK